MKNDTNRLVTNQLLMIEQCYGISITNKDGICRAISRATRNHREILAVALALNNWVAVHGGPECLTVPEGTVQEIICSIIGRT